MCKVITDADKANLSQFVIHLWDMIWDMDSKRSVGLSNSQFEFYWDAAWDMLTQTFALVLTDRLLADIFMAHSLTSFGSWLKGCHFSENCNLTQHSSLSDPLLIFYNTITIWHREHRFLFAVSPEPRMSDT